MKPERACTVVPLYTQRYGRPTRKRVNNDAALRRLTKYSTIRVRPIHILAPHGSIVVRATEITFDFDKQFQ